MAYDVVVIGGGHAGIEAAAAAARLGVRAALVTQDLAAIGRMSCNPAIGGVAKGQVVREIDALGGLMGLAADACGIHFRMLNSSKGPAVWGPRAQQDMDAYSVWMRRALEAMPGLELLEGEIGALARRDPGFDLDLLDGRQLRARAVVLAGGTFLGGRLFRGEEAWAGGRVGEKPADAIPASLRALGFRLRRLKTGTPARLRRDSIDWSACLEQPGDDEPWPFSFRTAAPVANRALCHIVRTNAETHAILREGFSRSPLFSGRIEGVGPRYCPSIEDKVSRFGERESHQLFLEPEGLGNDRIYINGFSSSLPADVQDRALRTIPGLASVEVIRYGYAVEYDAIDATELHPTLESRAVPGLWFAGQTNGTSGYEEAAGQGLVAGANAALSALGRAPLLLDRTGSYIGVMLDDLAGVALPEPYRLFTSRAECRLFLRHDNAEERLMPVGRAHGLVDKATWERFSERRARIAALRRAIDARKVSPDEVRAHLEAVGESVPEQSVRAIDLLRRPTLGLVPFLRALGDRELSPDGTDVDAASGADQAQLGSTGRGSPERVAKDPAAAGRAPLDRLALLHLRSEILYEGFRMREEREIERQRRLSGEALPQSVDWLRAEGISIEGRQSLARHRPMTVGQAARLPGITPADITVLLLHLGAMR